MIKKNQHRRILQERLLQLRQQQELTQAELAKKVGIPPAAISHFETGFRFPTAHTLTKLADALRTSIDYLLGRTTEPGRHEALFRNLQDLSDDSLEYLEGLSEQLREADARRRKGDRPKGS